MKRITNLRLLGLAAMVLIAMQTTASAQFLNEIEIDPPSTMSDACQFVELSGTAASVAEPNTYFLSVNSDAGNFGFANQALNIGGQAFGANGTIVLVNTLSDCPNRVYGTGSNRINYFSPLRIGSGSETYLLVRSTAPLATGQDLDTNDDGIFDAGFGITVLDGFALIVNPEEEYVYGATTGVVNISNTTSLDQPDAVTRFPGNTTPFLVSSFYFGELDGAPDETTVYAAPFSPNFPTGGVLTPGNVNAPISSSGFSISGQVTTPGGLGLRNAIVALTNSQGVRVTATTSSFGIYSFNNVPSDGTYILGVSSKRYRFNVRTLTVNGNLTNIDFVGLE